MKTGLLKYYWVGVCGILLALLLVENGYKLDDRGKSRQMSRQIKSIRTKGWGRAPVVPETRIT